MYRVILLSAILPAAACAASFTLEVNENDSAARVGYATALYNYNVALLDLERAAGTLDGKY